MIKMQALVPIAIILTILLYIFKYIPPTNSFIVLGVIVLITLGVSVISFHIPHKKYRYLIPVGICAFLLMNYLVGFQIINTILLISFIIGLAVLLP